MANGSNKRRLSILLINNYFPPEIGAASHLYYYLAKELLNRGHEVTVLTGIPRYNVDKSLYNVYMRKLKNDKYISEIVEGIKVIRVKLPFVERNQLLRRGVEHFEIALKLFKYSKSLLKNIDISLVYSPPLTLYWTAKKIRKLSGAPYILNVQDLFPQYAIDLGVLKNKFLISFFKNLEKKAYSSADLITVHSENNKKYVDDITEQQEKTIVIENWIDNNLITPGSKTNEFSMENQLTDKFVVSFAGTLGFAQDIEIIIKTANELKDYNEIVFVIVGDGVKKSESQALIEKYNLKNIVMLPTVSKEKYPLVLHSSDISLATLHKNVKTPTIPSKILSIMSAGIPIIASMNLNGDAPKLIEKANAGYAVPAGDYKSMAEKILLLFKSKELKEELGKNGRRYIEEYLSVRTAADKYEKLFQEVIKTRK